MTTFVDAAHLTVVTATGVEARAARAALRDVRVVEAGVGLSRLDDDVALGDVVISCGLAGALRTDIPTGTVVIPDTVLRPDGSVLACDGALVEGLDDAARRLGLVPERGAVLTSPTLVTGTARAQWVRRGYAAVDMESGMISAQRVAVVRVVLDTPARELSSAWLRPLTVIVRPDAWGQLGWLRREAPRCARLAADVIAAALKR